MSPSYLPELLAPREAAAWLRVSRQRVHDLVAEGRLQAIRTPLGPLVRGSSVLERIQQTQSTRSHANG